MVLPPADATAPKWPVRLTVGWILFAAYFLAIPAVVPVRSTGRWDHIAVFDQLIWIVPVFILIPALAISTLRMNNRSRIGTVGAWMLILLFAAFSIWIFVSVSGCPGIR